MNLLNLTSEELRVEMSRIGLEKYRADQVFKWVSKGVTDLTAMGGVPAKVRTAFEENGIYAALPKVIRSQTSAHDGTVKCLMEREDGVRVETVFMKYKYGNSVCISSQAGCRMGCVFCASGMKGLERSLSAGEMYGQILAIENETNEKISHIVVMGIGEPMDNYESLSAFLNIINDPKGKNLSMRNITVSTSGLIPKIDRFGTDFPQVNLAISLHAVTDEERSSLMPVNKAYPLKDLLEAVKRYTDKTHRRVTFEYTLIRGVNDDDAHLTKLAVLLKGMLCHVNLIPLNKVKGKEYEPGHERTAHEFRDELERHGIPATVRRELGSDIDAACGQLRLSSEKN
ncbi:MAG: 23S rRNA (adenine(2503)-C(2))-methyltransferase RlmN [Firmicutes bacterium]|nr:23S rRNA (adenine(2503)-C(2))-methyltransferase RlmN [Bacillota bacterium]